LLQGLQGLADVDGNGAITASELGAYIGPIVSSLSKQTPAFGNLIGSEGGEFVFELQQESLTEISNQLDAEAIKLNDELEQIQKEIATKRDRNLKLRQQVEEERAKLTVATRGKTDDKQGPKSNTAQAQNHHNMGLKFYREKKYDEALAELEQAIKLDPKNATIVNNYGFTLYKMEKYQESVDWFIKTINIDQNRAVAYVNLADAYVKLGKTKEARQNYEKYLQLSPQSSRFEEIHQKIEELSDK
jgi:tetratricopeptide (TPR) repeat protein